MGARRVARLAKQDPRTGQTEDKSKMNPSAGRLALHMLPGELVSDEDVVGDRWFDCQPEWPESGEGGMSASPEEWAALGDEALSAVSRAFERKAGSSEDAKRRILNKEKTFGDKLAAVTLMVQESPVHRLDELHMLLGFAKKKGRNESGQAVDALKDLLVNDLLPDDRRLLSFADRNFDVPRNVLSKRHLAYAMFESELKEVYRDFLGVIDDCFKDAVVHFKQKAARVCFDLLVAKPENEKALLGMLVNELGSPERKVASTTSYYLNLLVTKHHPAMKLVVFREVEQLVYRPNVGLRTRYYAISFLNQMRFSSTHDVELARRVVQLYMTLFAECVAADREGLKQRGDGGLESKESRLMGALLTGVNRAFPYSKPDEDDTDYSKQYESLFQVAHAQSLSSATQALALLFRVAQSSAVVSDRFYRALYSRIPDLASASETKQALFMNLLYKAMKADISSKRVKAYVKRLLQAALLGSPGFAAGALLLLSEVMVVRRRGLLKSFVFLSEADDAEEEFRDTEGEQGGYHESLEHPSMKGDADPSGIVVETASKDDATPLHEVDDGANHDERGAMSPGERIAPAGAVVWGSGYEPAKREPLFANAEQSCLWEIVALCSHYHPSVVKFAQSLCKEMKEVDYSGDPLKDMSFSAFLDKFCFRKPKKHVIDSLHGRRAARLADRPLVNTEEFRKMGEAGEIEEDEKFLFRFFHANPERSVRDLSSKRDGEYGSEAGDVEGMQPDWASVSGSEGEEEAFENAVREEMQRIDSGGGVGPGGDVDEVGEDELRAFQDTFANDLADLGSSDSDSDDNADGMRLIDPGEEEERMIRHEKGAKHESKKKKEIGDSAPSVFAPVEDFAEVLAGEEIAVHENGASDSDSAEPDEMADERHHAKEPQSKRIASRLKIFPSPKRGLKRSQRVQAEVGRSSKRRRG